MTTIFSDFCTEKNDWIPARKIFHCKIGAREENLSRKQLWYFITFGSWCCFQLCRTWKPLREASFPLWCSQEVVESLGMQYTDSLQDGQSMNSVPCQAWVQSLTMLVPSLTRIQLKMQGHTFGSEKDLDGSQHIAEFRWWYFLNVTMKFQASPLRYFLLDINLFPFYYKAVQLESELLATTSG